MEYQLSLNTAVIRTSDNAYIPADPANVDWQEYQKWLAEGHRPLPVDEEIPEIPDITPRQIRMALSQLGLRAEVEAAVAAGDQDIKDWWNYSLTFERNHPEVAAMAAALHVNDVQLDAVWKLGGVL